MITISIESLCIRCLSHVQIDGYLSAFKKPKAEAVAFSFMPLELNMSFEAELVDTSGVAEAGLLALIISPSFWI